MVAGVCVCVSGRRRGRTKWHEKSSHSIIATGCSMNVAEMRFLVCFWTVYRVTTYAKREIVSSSQFVQLRTVFNLSLPITTEVCQAFGNLPRKPTERFPQSLQVCKTLDSTYYTANKVKVKSLRREGTQNLNCGELLFPFTLWKPKHLSESIRNIFDNSS